MKYVTPLLRIDKDSDGSVQEAVDRINEDKVAYVDTEDKARAVLAAFGADQDMIDDRLFFASTGQTLYAL